MSGTVMLQQARDTHLTCETVTELCVQSAISALRRWHRFHSHRSLGHRVSPSYFSLACKGSRKMKTYTTNLEAVSLLTPEQYRVTQEDGTERPFQNE
jgi:hypothetical protein